MRLGDELGGSLEGIDALGPRERAECQRSGLEIGVDGRSGEPAEIEVPGQLAGRCWAAVRRAPLECRGRRDGAGRPGPPGSKSSWTASSRSACRKR